MLNPNPIDDDTPDIVKDDKGKDKVKDYDKVKDKVMIKSRKRIIKSRIRKRMISQG